MDVDFWVEEGRVTGCCAHGVVEDRAHWYAYHAYIGRGVGPGWGSREGMVEHLEHVFVVANLFAASGILVVWLFDGDFIEPVKGQ